MICFVVFTISLFVAEQHQLTRSSILYHATQLHTSSGCVVVVVFTTKPIVPLNFCYKPACVKRIRLKYDNKSGLLFFAKPSKSVSLSKTFFLNPEAYSDQWTDWSYTFFYQSWGKNQAMLGVPHFHPITFEAPLTRAPVLGSPPHQQCIRHTLLCVATFFFGQLSALHASHYGQLSTELLLSLAILSMTPLAPHASHPFLQGQSSSVKKICLKFEILA